MAGFKKIVCIGDSLTEGDYGIFGKKGIKNVNEKNYPYYLAKLLPDAEILNCGVCGITPSLYLSHYKKGKTDVSGADLIIIMLGTNGGLDDKEISHGDKDYDELVNLIKKDAPGAKIVLCAPPHVTKNETMSNFGYEDRVEKAGNFVRRYAKETSLLLIDFKNCALFNDENEPIMQPNDGLHFSEVGYGVMAVFIKDELKKLF